MNLSRVSKKVPHEDFRMTLTAIHEKKIKEFEEYYKTLPEKEAKLNALNIKLRSLRSTMSNESFKIKKEISILETELINMKNKTELSDYLLKAVYYIDEYKNSRSQNLEEYNNEFQEQDKQCENDNEENHVEIKSNRGQISKNFMQDCIGDGISLCYKLSKNQDSGNLVCCDIQRIINHKEAVAVCTECGSIVTYQDNDLLNEFSEEIEVLSPFSYKRVNHFKEWISSLLARESCSPPDDVIDILLLELRKNRIKDKKMVTYDRIRSYLKKHGLTKMYEHTHSIIYKICGTEPPKISRELENQLIKMFEEMDFLYDKYKPPNRKNFLSYGYCIFKMCQLLGQEEILDGHSFLLKSREKLYEQDKIFEKICTELGWKFIPTI
jgi:hypothetical protein